MGPLRWVVVEQEPPGEEAGVPGQVALLKSPTLKSSPKACDIHIHHCQIPWAFKDHPNWASACLEPCFQSPPPCFRQPLILGNFYYFSGPWFSYTDWADSLFGLGRKK